MSITSEEVFAELTANFGGTTDIDPYAVYAQRRRTSPVMEGDIMAEFGLPSFASAGGTRPAYTLLRYADVTAALRDHETFSNAIWIDLMGPLFGRTVLGMDGDEHRAWRGMLLPVFTRKAVAEWTETVLRPVAREAVAGLRAGRNRADLVPFAQQFPVRMIYDVIGLPRDDDAVYERFAVLAVTILLALAPPTDEAQMEQALAKFQRAVEASQELRGLIAPIVAGTRAAGAPGNGLISHLIRTSSRAAAWTTTRSSTSSARCCRRPPRTRRGSSSSRSSSCSSIHRRWTRCAPTRRRWTGRWWRASASTGRSPPSRASPPATSRSPAC
jgi:cytochrome P450